MSHLNIYQRKDGRWEGRIYHADQNTNIRRYRAFFGHSREETEEKILAFEKQNTFTATVSITFSQLYMEWEQANWHRIKESTAANYTLKADKHILPTFGSREITDISAADIYGFIRQKQEENLSNRYISDILILMKSVFKYGAIHYKIDNIWAGQKIRLLCSLEFRLNS